KGIFVKTLVAAVALNNMACLGLFEAARAAVQVALDTTTEHSTMDAVIAPFQQIFFAALLGGAAGLLLIALTRKVMRRDRLATASIISILFTSGLADFWGVSSLLACMFLGMTLANVTPDKDETGHHVFADFQGAIFAIFFTLAGLELDLGYLIGGGGLIAIAVVAMRIIGKVGSARIAMRIAGATKGVRENLGYALVPQAGVAVGLIFLVREEPALASLHEPMLAIGLTVVTLNEIIGPILTRFALSRSGDFGKDRARLIDFLHEENIVTDLQAETKEDAIRELAELLIQSNHLKDDRQRLMQSILDRERDVSTCVGGGLAVPHGVLDQLLDHFGRDAVAEVTGRSRRFVRVVKDGIEQVVEERRSRVKCDADVEEFMAGKKRVLVFSQAGGTGRSYHADLAAENQEQRVLYCVEPGWSSMRCVQGMGRVHRANQACPPELVLVTTNLKAQRRFLSTIARRRRASGARAGDSFAMPSRRSNSSALANAGSSR
ncbi:MAG: strawberry notch C-terminal domain-containing protein, partial [bacterium]